MLRQGDLMWTERLFEKHYRYPCVSSGCNYPITKADLKKDGLCWLCRSRKSKDEIDCGAGVKIQMVSKPSKS